VAEAGLAPGLLLYLTWWFPAQRRARMTVLWFVAIPLSGMIGGPLSGWIMETFAGSRGWAGWQWMFMLEAIPTILMGFVVLVVLKDRVEQAKWLDESEKNMVRADLEEDNQQKSHHGTIKAFVADKRLWTLAAIYFCVVMGQYALTFWLPTLVRNAGIREPLHIGLLTSLPYLCAIVFMLIAGRSGDRHRERRWHLIIPMLLGMAGLTLATLLGHSVALSLSFLCLAAAGILSASSLFWMLPTNLLGGVSAAAGIAAVNCIANLAGFFSPWLIGGITTLTGSPASGMYFIAAVLLLGALCVLRIRAADVNR